MRFQVAAAVIIFCINAAPDLAEYVEHAYRYMPDSWVPFSVKCSRVFAAILLVGLLFAMGSAIAVYLREILPETPVCV